MSVNRRAEAQTTVYFHSGTALINKKGGWQHARISPLLRLAAASHQSTRCVVHVYEVLGLAS